MKASALRPATSWISSSHVTQGIVSLPHKPLTTIIFGQTHFLLTPKLCRHTKLLTNLISAGDATSRLRVLCLLMATSGPTPCRTSPPGSILVDLRIVMRSDQVLPLHLSSCLLCCSIKAVVSIPVVSILGILVANIPAVSTPLSDVHQPTALDILPVGCTRHVKLLVPWTILLIYRHDLWLLWALVHHHLVVVRHGGPEGETGLAGEAYHIHSPLFMFIVRIYCALSICAFVSFLCSLAHTAQFVLSDVIGEVDHVDF